MFSFNMKSVPEKFKQTPEKKISNIVNLPIF